MPLTILLLSIGFLVLVLGADLMIRGSSTIALKLGVSPLLIGLTVVAFGTSAPELAVSVESTLAGRSPLALANVIGSNIANIGLILGLLAIVRPINIEQQLIKKQIPLLIASSVILWLILLNGEIEFLEGILLFAGLIGFLVISYQQARRDGPERTLIESKLNIAMAKKSTLLYAGLLITGLAMLVYGSTLFVDSAVELAMLLGISEVIIGLSIVAIGTSIPELATTIVAAIRGETAMAVGNVVGSNLFNILGILGLSAMLDTINGSQFNVIDFGVMLTYAIILLPFAWTDLKISRAEGVALLSGYAAYMYYIFITH